MAVVTELSTESNSPAAQVPDASNTQDSPVKSDQPTEKKEPESVPEGSDGTEGAVLKEKAASLDKSSTPIPTSEERPRAQPSTVGVAGRIVLLALSVIAVVVVFLFFFSLGVGIAAGNGAFIEFVGNIILRSAGKSGYTTDRIAAIVGAVGGTLAGFIVAIIFSTVVPKTSVNSSGVPQHSWWVSMTAPVLAGTLTGAIGLRIMEKHIDLQGFDLLHAVRAGALGGTITGLAAIFIYPIAFGVLGLLLTPLWLAMMALIQFIANKGQRASREEEVV